MNKMELVNVVSKQTGWPGDKTALIINGLLEAIGNQLASGGEVRLNGLGTFKVAETAARTCRNPKTGETVKVPAGRKVSFKAAQKLKERL